MEMDPQQIQKILTKTFEGDHVRVARTAHFMGLVKSGVDGMATLGIILRINVHGLQEYQPAAPAPDPLSSLDTAIALMMEASRHATHEEGHEDKISNG